MWNVQKDDTSKNADTKAFQITQLLAIVQITQLLRRQTL